MFPSVSFTFAPKLPCSKPLSELATSMKLVIRLRYNPLLLHPSLNVFFPTPTWILPHLFFLRECPGRHKACSMSSTIIASTIQACVLSATSSVVAQWITAYKNDVRSHPPRTASQTLINTQASFLTDWTPVFQFILFTALNTPPNMLWYHFPASFSPTAS